MGTRRLLVSALTAALVAACGGHAGTPGNETASPAAPNGFALRLDSCAWSAPTGTLHVVARLAPTSALESRGVSARTLGLLTFGLEVTYPDGSPHPAALVGSIKGLGFSGAISGLPGPPKELAVTSPRLSWVADAVVRASSFSALQGKTISTPAGDIRILRVNESDSTVEVLLALDTPSVVPGVPVTGVEGVQLILADGTSLAQASQGTERLGSELRVTVSLSQPQEAKHLQESELAKGPVTLRLGGIGLTSADTLTVSLPAACGVT
jgi:hypothetical protein